MAVISLREYGRLTTAYVEPSLDRATVSERDFDWLLAYSARLSLGGARLSELEGKRTLAVENYVGVLELPSGNILEILPKHSSLSDDPEQLRKLVLKMIAWSMDVRPMEGTEAHLMTLRYPVSEWLILQFLRKLDGLISRGLRAEYHLVEEESRFLRGQLDVVRQIRQPPERMHRFQVRHDVFTFDRPENRLIKLALDVVARRALSPEVRRLANMCSAYLHELRCSDDVEGDLRRWSHGRLMNHYEPIRPWCELIVRGYSPVSQSGAWRGISMLFPMERLFERYVARALLAQLVPSAKCKTQARSESLCVHQGEPWFTLSPDVVIRYGGVQTVLDTKWKMLDETGSSSSSKYGISQADMYQLFAYGHKYLGGRGEVLLVFPKHEGFQRPLRPFEFSEALRLWAVPFCLDTARLVEGEWIAHSPWHASFAPNVDQEALARR